MTPPTSSPPRILLVEDDLSSGRTLAQLLRQDGYEVEVVLDGAEAVARLGRPPVPDILIVDYRLPRINGLDVAACGRRWHPSLGVVIVTSYPEVISRLDPHLDPPAMVLPKPLAYADLTRELERIQKLASTPA